MGQSYTNCESLLGFTVFYYGHFVPWIVRQYGATKNLPCIFILRRVFSINRDVLLRLLRPLQYSNLQQVGTQH